MSTWTQIQVTELWRGAKMPGHPTPVCGVRRRAHHQRRGWDFCVVRWFDRSKAYFSPDAEVTVTNADEPHPDPHIQEMSNAA